MQKINKTILKSFGTSLFFIVPCMNFDCQAQNAWTRSTKGIEYNISIESSNAHGKNPLWLTANRYGLSSVEKNNGLMQVGIERNSLRDSLHNWKIGYVADIAIGYNHTSTAIIHQMAANIDWKMLSLSIGAKEEPMAMKNMELSSGGQTFGINARPVPQFKFGIPEYVCITGKKRPWAAIRGFISYGMMTDSKFQRDYVAENQRYTRRVLYHAKAGYLRLGNAAKFPFTFEGGLEIATQFGGTVYNFDLGFGKLSSPIHLGHSIKDMIKATLGTGSDPLDGVYANSSGNTLGSWLFKLNYESKTWGASVYYDHYFEDHSQLFMEYGWLDGLIGVELNLPKNPIVSNAVYEFIKTTYQSGPLYHDHTDAIPDQISGNDKYYNHALFGGWQHWGQALGNPLYTSPLYNPNGKLDFMFNRFKAHHVGINGNPIKGLHYRLLYSFERTWGTYDDPLEHSITNHSMLIEANYSPLKIGNLNTEGWNLGLSFALDHGQLLGNNTGFLFKISKTGLLTH